MCFVTFDDDNNNNNNNNNDNNMIILIIIVIVIIIIIIIIIIIVRLYSLLRALVYQLTASLTSISPQTEVKDHPANLGVTCG